MRKRKSSEMGALKSILELFMDGDVRSLAFVHGLTVAKYEELVSALKKEGSITPRDMRCLKIGEIVTLLELISAMMEISSQESDTQGKNPLYIK